jgi:hypothetical protein
VAAVAALVIADRLMAAIVDGDPGAATPGTAQPDIIDDFLLRGRSPTPVFLPLATLG